jgi:hypothetical protein
MHHLDGVVATFPDLLAPIDGQDGNVHAVAVAALVKLLARLELLKSRIGQQGILRSVRRQIPSWYMMVLRLPLIYPGLLLILQTKWRPVPINFIQQARSIAIKLGAVMMEVSPQRLNPTFPKTQSNEHFLDVVDWLAFCKQKIVSIPNESAAGAG